MLKLSKSMCYIVNTSSLSSLYFRLGRRKATMAFFMGTVTFSLLFVILHLATVSMGSAMAGLAIASVWCLGCTWPTIAIFTVEIFPTLVRYLHPLNFGTFLSSVARSSRGRIRDI